MRAPTTDQEARESLNQHAARKGGEIHVKYGPVIGWEQLQRILEDRTCVRYPCVIQFDHVRLEPGEMAYAAGLSGHPEDGFIIYVHPLFQTELDAVPYLVLYQLVVVNYGPFASADDAEAFGASALGLNRDQYYNALCQMADRLNPDPTTS